MDTQGLFHEQKATTIIEATRVRDMLARYHSNRLIIILDSRISDTSKNSDAAVCRMLGTLSAQCEIYFVYTQWDRLLRGCVQKVYTDESKSSGRSRKKVNWDATFELQKKLLDERHRAFYTSLASNKNKRQPSICGTFYSAILEDEESPSEDLLYDKGFTIDNALEKLANQILSKQVLAGPKFRVIEEKAGTLIKLNTNGLPVQSINALYNNLNECKIGRLYASTVRASVSKWRLAGTEHEATVNDNPHNFVAIRTKFVPEIQKYAVTFIPHLLIDVSSFLCDVNDAKNLETKLLEDLRKNLGFETAKRIGQDAYDNAFTQPIPFNPFPYQYDRLHHMFDYTQRKYFRSSNISLTAPFQEILEASIDACVQNFIDASCIVVS